MIRFALYIATGSAWTMSLLIIGAYAGWTFVAVKSVGISALSNHLLARGDPEQIPRYVGGEITRMPFDVAIWSSVFIPPILLSMQGGWRGLRVAQIMPPTRWWNRASRLALVGAFLSALYALQLSIDLRAASIAYWSVASGADQQARDMVESALIKVHTSAERAYLAIALLAALSTVCGAVFMALRASILSRIEKT